jgi:hypothetical protein
MVRFMALGRVIIEKPEALSPYVRPGDQVSETLVRAAAFVPMRKNARTMNARKLVAAANAEAAP